MYTCKTICLRKCAHVERLYRIACVQNWFTNFVFVFVCLFLFSGSVLEKSCWCFMSMPKYSEIHLCICLLFKKEQSISYIWGKSICHYSSITKTSHFYINFEGDSKGYWKHLRSHFSLNVRLNTFVDKWTSIITKSVQQWPHLNIHSYKFRWWWCAFDHIQMLNWALQINIIMNSGFPIKIYVHIKQIFTFIVITSLS